MRSSTFLRRPAVSLAAIVLSLAAASTPAQAGILAPNAVVAGKSVGQWGGEYWKWLFSYPADNSPLFLNTPEVWERGNIGGPVFFLNASGGTPVDIAINVPAGQYILFPMLTYVDNYAPADFDEATVRAELDGLIGGISGLYAIINGVPVTNPSFYRSDSGVFDFVIPPDGVDVPGTYRAIQGGYWIMLDPLPLGVHTLSFGGAVPADGFFADAKVRITITPEPATFALVGASVLALLFVRRR